MESWLPWLTDEERILLDLLPADAQILLVEPRRMRDRAAELLDEEAALAATLASTWGAGGQDFPRLHLPFDRLLAQTEAPAWTVTAAPEGPGTVVVAATGWDPVDGRRRPAASSSSATWSARATGSWCAPRAGAAAPAWPRSSPTPASPPPCSPDRTPTASC